MGPEPDPTSKVAGMSAWGWMSPDELKWLRGAARRMSSVVEIGALHGRSSLALLTGCKGLVYCVDPWNDEGNFCYPSFMASCGHMPNLRPVRGYSPQVADQIPDVDMVFLDGAHDEASVVADIEAWRRKAKRLLCGHDFIESPDAAFPDVAKVVRRYFGDRVTVAKNTAIWAVNMQDDA